MSSPRDRRNPISVGPVPSPNPATFQPPAQETIHLYRRNGFTWCGEIAAEVKITQMDDSCTCFVCQREFQDYIDSYESENEPR